jgi:DNA-binding GntR family transcriptional regulator
MSTDFFADISFVAKTDQGVYSLVVETQKTESLTDEVYRILLEKLLNSQFVPGHVLDRKKIADELNVSMAPVRDALMKLDIEGFVDTLPRKGTIVKAVDRDDLYGSLILREAVEVQAARMYCGSKMDPGIPKLLLYAQAADDPSTDFVEHWKSDVAFHKELIAVSGCRALVTEFTRFMKIATFYHVNRYLTRNDIEERRSHKELLYALREATPDEAESIIRDHLKSGKRTFF